MKYTDKLVVKALDFAREAHKGQLYGKEDYFLAHISKVVTNLLVNGESNMAQIVGALHDIFEDTGNLYTDKVATLFGEEVYLNLWELTRRKGEQYFSYIKRINSPVAKKVKIEDVTCNYRASVLIRDDKRMGRYAKALLILLGYD